MTATALVVIDVQESFRQRPYWSADDLPVYFAKQQALIDGCVASGIPVVQIFHVDGDDAFSLASGHVRTLEEVTIRPDVTFHKSVHSALSGTPLAAWLTARGIHRLIVSGIRTEQCCETTARHASDLGYEVDFVGQATMTWPMTTRAGRLVSADEIRERTELVLATRFANIVDVDVALARATAAAAQRIAA
jgi:nicotinamidase-related amidase